MDNITLKWTKGMTFETHIDNHKLIVGAPSTQVGVRPKPLILVALAGCSGLDVVSLATKMRVDFDDFELESTAQASSEVPVVYTSFHLVYKFYGQDLPHDKLIKMVSLSQEKYCGVAEMLRHVAPLTYEVTVNDNRIFSSDNLL